MGPPASPETPCGGRPPSLRSLGGLARVDLGRVLSLKQGLNFLLNELGAGGQMRTSESFLPLGIRVLAPIPEVLARMQLSAGLRV